MGSAFNGAGVSAYVADVGNAQEMVLTASGGLGETEIGGPTLNIVPKEGGNTSRHRPYFGRTQGWSAATIRRQLKDSAPRCPAQLRKIWDYTRAVGGPILKNRLWFFATAREKAANTIPGMFANTNAGDPNKLTYVQDPTRPAYLAASYRIYTDVADRAGDAAQQGDGSIGTSRSPVKAGRTPASAHSAVTQVP